MFYRTYSAYDFVYCAIIASTISVSLDISIQGFSFKVVIVIFALVSASLAAGRSILSFTNTQFGVASEFLLGMLVLNVLILLLSVAFSISAGHSSLAVMTAVFVGASVAWSRNINKSPTNKRDLLVLALICIGSFIWSWQAIEALPRLMATGKFDAWTDYFIHSAEISQFANLEFLGGRSIFAAGAALPPYHYGSYMIPAAICSLTTVPALGAITAIWTPLGFIMLGLGTYVLGTNQRNENSGLLSIVGIFMVPSAAYYGLENPFFDFHWLLQISSGGSYAIAGACLSISALVIWMRDKRSSMLCVAVLLTFLVALFRMQIFIPLAIANILVFFIAWHPRRPLFKILFGALLFGLILVALVGMEHLDRAPHFFSGAHHPVGTLLLMHGMKPSAYAGFYKHFVAAPAPSSIFYRKIWEVFVLLVGLVLLLIAAFGAVLPVYIFGLACRYFRKIKENSDYIPLLGILTYLTIVVTFPDTAEPLEFSHRPYVLFYTLSIIWSAVYISDLLSYFFSENAVSAVAIVLAVMFLPVPLRQERFAQTSHLAWSNLYSDIKVPKGIVESANYIRIHSTPGQVVVMGNDRMAEAFLALTERPEFYPGTEFLKIQSGLSETQVIDREDITDQILSSPKTAASEAVEQRFNICWMVRFQPGTVGASAADPSSENVSVSMINPQCRK